MAVRLLAIVAICASLYLAKNLLMPIAFAVVLALTFSPLVQLGARWRIPGIVSAIIIMLTITTIVASAVMGLAQPFAELVEEAPQIGSQLKEKLRDLREPMESLNRAESQAEELTKGEEPTQEVVIKSPGLVARAADDFVSIIANLAFTLVLMFFLLISRDLFLTKVIRVLPTLSDRKKALAVAKDIEQDVSKYLLTVAIINTILGCLVGMWCWYVGMPTPILFGVLAALLNFLPYIGSALGILITAGVAVITFDTLSSALLVPAGYFLLTVLEGQFITPAVLGRRFSINTVVILLTIGFWGFIWGPIGVLLAVPLLIIFKAFCDRVESFENISEFLSGARPPPDRE